MVMEDKNGLTGPYMKDSGKMIRLTDRVSSFMVMETSMKASGKTIRHMVKEVISMRMGHPTLVNGPRISNMVKGKRNGPMVLSMKGNIRMERSTIKVL